MKLTIIPDDGRVSVDGYYFDGLDMSNLDNTIHAVQWYDTWGEVEFKTQLIGSQKVKPENQLIDSVEPYQWAIDLWSVAKAEEDAFLAAEEDRLKKEAEALEIPVVVIEE